MKSVFLPEKLRHIIEAEFQNGDQTKVTEYARIYAISLYIKDLLVAGPKVERVAYYTTLEHFAYMLPDHCTGDKAEQFGRLTLMNVAYMNDPSEGQTLLETVYRNAKAVDFESGRKLVPVYDVFIKSFSDEEDSLPMWKMYGDDAKGICVVLDREQSFGQEEIYHVCYVKNNKSGFSITKEDNPCVEEYKEVEVLVKELRRVIARTKPDRIKIRGLLGDCCYLFKAASYRYERELRILHHLNEHNLYYTDQTIPKVFILSDDKVRVSEIILGPKTEDTLLIAAYLHAQLDSICDWETVISKSDIKYK